MFLLVHNFKLNVVHGQIQKNLAFIAFNFFGLLLMY